MADRDADAECEFSYPIDVAALTTSGRAYTIKADEGARTRIAQRLNLQRVESLTAVLEVKSVAGGQIKVTGNIDAAVVQTCGVTLAPVAAQIHETVTAMFVTEDRAAREKRKREKAVARGEDIEDLVLGEDDPPEVAKHDRLDLGEVAVVHLALALDPYPRAPGAAFKPQDWGLDPEKPADIPAASPFAALAKLKPPGPGNGTKGGRS